MPAAPATPTVAHPLTPATIHPFALRNRTAFHAEGDAPGAVDSAMGGTSKEDAAARFSAAEQVCVSVLTRFSDFAGEAPKNVLVSPAVLAALRHSTVEAMANEPQTLSEEHAELWRATSAALEYSTGYKLDPKCPGCLWWGDVRVLAVEGLPEFAAAAVSNHR